MVLCIYVKFNSLFSIEEDLLTIGEIFVKLKLAVEDNCSNAKASQTVIQNV